MSKKKYAGEMDVVFEKRNNKTVISNKCFSGLIKLSPTIHLDSEKISTYFILGIGGGYVEGEKYRNIFKLEKESRAIITTQASTKIYKCPNGLNTEQETLITLEKDSVLEYITDPVILYKDAIYKQINNIYMDESSTLIYTDGITSGWSPDGDEFKYRSLQLKTNVYVNNKIILIDNLLVDTLHDDVRGIGYFEGYKNFGTLLVINSSIDEDVICELRKKIKDLDLPIYFGISKLEVNGFVLRVLGDLTQNIEMAINVCHNLVRERFLGSKKLFIRKY